MSALVYHDRGRKTVMTPRTAPVYTFDTPIRQIEAPSLGEVSRSRPGTHLYRPALTILLMVGSSALLLGVRTMSSAAFLQVKYTPGRVRKRPGTIEANPVMIAQRADIGDRHAVDLCVSCVDPASGYVVNDIGHVYRCRNTSGGSVL